ncbi:unnamed protein product [Ectocarpus sp. 4 AP-2014]
MVRSWTWIGSTGSLLLSLGPHHTGAITVELSEVLAPSAITVDAEWQGSSSFSGTDPISHDCPLSGRCIGQLTRDGSLELDSRYDCTRLLESASCGVRYGLIDSAQWEDLTTISSVRIALHPDSVQSLQVGIGQNDLEAWEADPDLTAAGEMQEIPAVEGLTGSDLYVYGDMEIGESLRILEVEIYVTVDEVEATGVSASTRASVTATASADSSSAMNTLDGDVSAASSWTCSAGDEVCEITFDLQAVESLEQLRIAFSDETDAVGGEFSVMAAGESGVFSAVRTGLEADPAGRPLGTDGLQTFGGVRAMARYVKLGVTVPTSGGTIAISEVELRVGEDVPARPVAEKAWLKTTGPLPRAVNTGGSRDPSFDIRLPEDGGCDPPIHFDGCHVFYIKDENMDSRWTCGPLVAGSDRDSWDCDLEFSLNYFRYIRQIQIAFYTGDGEHNEFSIEAYTATGEWVTVVPSAISSEDDSDYQTFDVAVHTNTIRLLPKFGQITDFIGIKELVFLEKRKNDFIEGTIPVFSTRIRSTSDDDEDDGADVDIPTRFEFDLQIEGNYIDMDVPPSTVTALRMRFPADRSFVFMVEYDDVIEEFTSAGGPKTWETFTLATPAEVEFGLEVVAVTGPTFNHIPDYPALRVVDLQVVGELRKEPGYIDVVTTTIETWGVVPDVIGEGVSEQKNVMKAMCEAKGSTFDGVDCVGELNDSEVTIKLHFGDYYIDGPIFLKSGVFIDGDWKDEYPTFCWLVLYDGDSNTVTGEDAMVVVDGATGAELYGLAFVRKEDPTGDIVPGTVGNTNLAVRNSQDIQFSEMGLFSGRNGGATFTDSRNMSAFIFYNGDELETGNYMELTRVDDVHFRALPNMSGVLFDTCNDIVFEGVDEFAIPLAYFSPPVAGSDQTANVVVTGDSSGIVFQNFIVAAGAEPRILVESTEPLTLDNVIRYADAEIGDCIVEVPEGTDEDFVVQVRTNPFSDTSSIDTINQLLAKSGTCWVLE